MNPKIIIVTSHRVDESLGGVERFVASYSTWCSRNGFALTVVSRSLSIFSVKITHGPVEGAVSSDQQPITVKKVKLPYIIYSFGMAIFSFLAFISLLRIIKRSRIIDNKPIVLHSQDMNFAAIATVLAGGLLSVRTILHQHGPYVDMLTGYSRWIEEALNIFSSRLCSHIIVTDKNTARYVTCISGGDEKISIIPAAVNTSAFKYSLGNKPCYFTIGYIGRLSTEKNIETLIAAFKIFRSNVKVHCKLMIVGDGECRTQLQQLALKLGITEDVMFAGFQPNVADFLDNFDIFVLPSKVEGTPISLMEAMASRKAIVCSDIPSLREIVGDGVDGFYFRVGDCVQLARLLLCLYNNPILLNRLASNAQKNAQKFDVNEVYSRILSSYSP